MRPIDFISWFGQGAQKWGCFGGGNWAAVSVPLH